MTPAKWHKRPIGISGLKQQEHRRVIICEGEKDSIAVMHAYASDNSSALVCMPSTTTNLTGTTIPSFIQEVIILAQHDKQGIEAALKWHAWASATVTKVEIRLPQLDGLDWADLLMLLTAPHAQDTLLRGIAQSIFTTQEDLNELNELLQTAPETPPAKRPAKQRGSKPNLERDENIRAVMRGLPTQDKKSPTKICLALGWNLNSANRTKIRRSLSRIDQT